MRSAHKEVAWNLIICFFRLLSFIRMWLLPVLNIHPSTANSQSSPELLSLLGSYSGLHWLLQNWRLELFKDLHETFYSVEHKIFSGLSNTPCVKDLENANVLDCWLKHVFVNWLAPCTNLVMFCCWKMHNWLSLYNTLWVSYSFHFTMVTSQIRQSPKLTSTELRKMFLGFFCTQLHS